MKKSPEDIEHEVESIREELDPVLSELDRRRHEMMDWRAQLRRRGPAVFRVMALLIGGFVAYRRFRNLRRMRTGGGRFASI